MIADLDKKGIIEIHDNIVKESCEEFDILSNYKLDSIISRHKKAKTIVRKAAILLHDIPHLQPFSEGNKRTAFASILIFLKYNKKELKITDKKLEEIIINSVNNNLTLRDVEKTIRKGLV